MISEYIFTVAREFEREHGIRPDVIAVHPFDFLTLVEECNITLLGWSFTTRMNQVPKNPEQLIFHGYKIVTCSHGPTRNCPIAMTSNPDIVVRM